MGSQWRAQPTREIPARVREMLNGRDLREKEGVTLLALTTGVDGWPHAALLSVGEVVVTSAGIRLALYANSHTEQGLRASGRVTLLVVDQAFAATIKLSCRTLAALDGAPNLAAYSGSVEEVREHAVAYARILHGIEFELLDPSVPERWMRTIEALVAAPEKMPG